jgi:hypothetical protein
VTLHYVWVQTISETVSECLRVYMCLFLCVSVYVCVLEARCFDEAEFDVQVFGFMSARE